MDKVKLVTLGSIRYFEYLLTGFYELNKERKIKFSYKREKIRYNIGKYFNAINSRIVRANLPIYLKDSNICQLVILSCGRKYKVALDCMDTPWEFFDSVLENVDIYYKLQCPIDVEKGYYDLNDENRYYFSETVNRNLHKIKPLCIMRPLSRKMNFKSNLKILKEYKLRRQDGHFRNDKLLVYMGNAEDSIEYRNIDHPHLKRLKTMVELTQLHDSRYHIVFSKPTSKESITSYSEEWDSYYKQLTPIHEKVTDEMYRDWCFNSEATLNIAGLRGSIPFRFPDAFLSNMLIITDHPMVKWYVPFEETNQIINIGKMGYEILDKKDFDSRIKMIQELVNNMDDIYKTCTFDFYDKYLAPRVLAIKILDDLSKLEEDK